MTTDALLIDLDDANRWRFAVCFEPGELVWLRLAGLQGMTSET